MLSDGQLGDNNYTHGIINSPLFHRGVTASIANIGSTVNLTVKLKKDSGSREENNVNPIINEENTTYYK